MIAATFPCPAAAKDLNCFMKLKLLVNELVETLEGPLARTEAEAPPPPTLTSVADNTRESPPSMPALLLKRTLSPFGPGPSLWAGPLLTAFYPCVAGCVAVLFQVQEPYRGHPRIAGHFLRTAVALSQAGAVARTQAAAPDNPASSPRLERTMERSAGRWPGRSSTMSRTGWKNASCRPMPPPMITVLGEKVM